MPYHNISSHLSHLNYNDIVQKLDDIVALLPMLVHLTPEERQGGLKMGDKSLAFVLKALEYAEANPNLVPPFLDVAEFRTDEDLREQLTLILRKVEQLREGLDDTVFALGREEYTQALTFYHSVQQAAKGNVPGSTTIEKDLHERFVHSKPDSSSGTPPPTGEPGEAPPTSESPEGPTPPPTEG